MDPLKFDDPVEPISRFSYSEETKQWVPNDNDKLGKRPTKITTLTLNVWFELHYFQERSNALVRLIGQTEPDIVCFQECTARLLEILTKNKLIQDKYCLSDIDGRTFQGYGVLILTKKEIFILHFLRKLPSRMGRKLLVGCLFFEDGTNFCVGTSHLESSRNAPIRKQQLEVIFPILEKIVSEIAPKEIQKLDITVPCRSDDIMFMGDCNYDPTWDDCIEEEVVQKHDYKDLYTELCQGPGYTQPPNKNHKGHRIDRVLLKSTQCKPFSIHIVGTDDIGTNCSECKQSKGACTISDHFGLHTVVLM